MGALLGTCGGKSRSAAVVVAADVPRKAPSQTLVRQRSIHEGLVRVREPTDSVEEYYEVLDCIGQGSFSKVFRIKKKEEQIGGTSRPINVKKKNSLNDEAIPSHSNHSSGAEPTGTRIRKSVVVKKDLFFVLKEINLTHLTPKQIDQLLNEVSLLTTIDHQSIIKIYETFSKKQSVDGSPPLHYLQIVMEYCSGGDLSTRFPYTEHRVARIIRQIVSAISYLHDRNIIHRDLKLENIVFENERPDSIVKLIDFGVSLVYTPTTDSGGLTERVGTIYSMAPETMKGHYSSQADLWSLGVCTYMLLSNGAQPFDAPTNKQIVQKVLQGEYSTSEPTQVWSPISDAAKSFMRTLLVVDPARRATAETAKQDPWLKDHHSQRFLQGDLTGEATKDRVRAAILQYASTGDFVKFAMNVVAKKSTGQEIEELRALFDEFDRDQTGTLDLAEFKAFFNDKNQYSEEYVEKIFHQIDVNKSNNISYTEFLAAVMEMQGRIEEYRLAEAFDQIDFDASGYISKDDLRLLLGDRVDEQYIDQLIAEADCSNDGKISYSAFLQAFREQMRDLVGSVKSISNISTMDSMPDFDAPMMEDAPVFQSLTNLFKFDASR